MASDCMKPNVVVIGPVRANGGMATAMGLQLSSSLGHRYNLIPFDNSKQTPRDRTLWQGIRAQLKLAAELRRGVCGRVHVGTDQGPVPVSATTSSTERGSAQPPHATAPRSGGAPRA